MLVGENGPRILPTSSEFVSTRNRPGNVSAHENYEKTWFVEWVAATVTNVAVFISLTCVAFLTLQRPENIRHLLRLVSILDVSLDLALCFGNLGSFAVGFDPR